MGVTKILIANRGEIAVRVIRTCRAMGIPTVAVYSEADRGALHVRMADEAYCIGPAPARESYLVVEKILDACLRSGADAVHPGYGFLSENAEAARVFAAAGITFIGPPAEAIVKMGSKTAAREVAIAAGCPVVPGIQETMADEALLVAAEKIGFPVMLKAAMGGGGKGMRLVQKPEEFASALARARGEALSSFGDDSVYVEKAILQPRHIEIQVFSDAHGNHVYLHERECSVQRRHQKVIEEAPSPHVTPEMRKAMGEAALKVARAVNYVGAGTVEFLADADRNFYFLEMNTRLQVEHPVTEWITGLDLVKWQILVARGEALPLAQEEIPLNGWAVECRVYAEDPDKNFMPSPGRITFLRTPSGPGVRDDGGVYEGADVPMFYDPMISKLSAWGPTRLEAIDRMRAALGEYRIGGIRHNIAFHEALMEHGPFREGALHTGMLDKPFWKRKGQGPDLQSAVAAALLHELEAEERRAAQPSAGGPLDAWKHWGRFNRL
ncbi:acetyl/propionyl/methylcrotonyl-CoA carboxylase subunit alpha [Geothrix sp. 21YS21S-4]|uniref:acetyl-CoA carboxylase biotin carboxylase subunit n=1 Tax=Geothrix sp. 21YS21S-4 TaxID=3068889 RepID=UPI003593B81D